MMPIPDRIPLPTQPAADPRRPTLLALALLATTAAAQEGQSTFGQARARELAALGRLPTAHEVVVRDFVNYHRHRLPSPTADQPVAIDIRFDRARAQPGDEVWLQVGYATRSEGDRSLAAPCAVALVVDCSGSMAERGKMTQVQRGLDAFADRLRDDDLVAVVGFSTEARLVAGLQPRGDGAWLHRAIGELRPDGNTNLHAGLMLGIDELLRRDHGDRTCRVVLLTDGIANTGITDAGVIAAEAKRASGGRIDIATIGVGDNLDSALLQRLAAENRGLFHFVADERDVQKVFVRESESLMTPVARGVNLVIEIPDGLAVEHIYERNRRSRDGRIEVRLPDLNAGVTGVVLVRCRRTPADPEREAAAAMVFGNVATRKPWVASAGAGVPPADDGDAVASPTAATVDLEVRKNAAIAVLAEGLHTMAEACDARRWADADRALRLAVDDARRLFPGADDDVQRVRDLVAGHQRTLSRYVDRFRGL